MSATNIDDSFNAEPPPAVPVDPTVDDILGALVWSAPKEVATKNGPRLMSCAPAGPAVFDLWKKHRSELFDRGFSLGQWKNKWQVTKWEKLPEKIVVKREEAKALSRATDAEINVPAPEGLQYLGYQKAGIAFAHERPAALIGDEMGLGKTIQAIGIVNANPELKRGLVVCPASLKLNWHRELSRWLVRPRGLFIADAKICPSLADGIVIINYDVLHKHAELLRDTEWDFVVFDEGHYLKNPKARRTQIAFGIEATAKERANGAADVPGIMAKKRIILTGTPIANRPVELWPLIHYLDPINWNNFFRYAQRYCDAKREYVGRQSHWDFSGASNLSELQDKLRSTIMVRRLKKDVLTELPAKRRQVIEIPATGDLARLARQGVDAYDEIEQLEAAVELAAASDDQEDYRTAIANLSKSEKAVFEGLSTLRLETGIAMIPSAIEHLREVMEEVEKVVVFGHHKEVLAAIKSEFGEAAVMIVGDTPMPERQANADRFQQDPTCKMIIGSFGAMGVGWTLTAAAHLVTVEQDWVPGNVSQAEDRIHRIGQKESVLVQHLVLAGSVGATIMRRIVSKQDVIDQALDTVKEPAKEGPPRRQHDTRTELADLAAQMTQAQQDAAAEAIQFLATRCNGARDWDGAGFSKIDTRLGKELAQQASGVFGLSPKQAALARKVAMKYHKQLSAALFERMKDK